MADRKTPRPPRPKTGAAAVAAPIRRAAAGLSMTEEPSSFVSALEQGAPGGRGHA